MSNYEKIEKVLQENSALCMDNANDRLILCTALVKAGITAGEAPERNDRDALVEMFTKSKLRFKLIGTHLQMIFLKIGECDLVFEFNDEGQMVDVSLFA